MTIEHNADSGFIDLKTARENSGLTLKDLFERTRISVVNLVAIENGSFHLLPVPIYTRNFIKTYANVLGVDSKPILQRYENYLQTLQMKEKGPRPEQSPRLFLAAMLSRYKVYLLIFCIIIVFAAVAFFASFYNKPAPEVLQKTEAKKEAVVPQTKAQNTIQEVVQDIVQKIMQPENLSIVADERKSEYVNPAINKIDEQKQPVQQANTVQPTDTTVKPEVKQKTAETKPEAPILDKEASVLVVQATEETWIRIKADDKEPVQVLLKPGEKILHKAARFNIDIGNANGIKIQFNGKYIDNLGKSGQVIHLRLP